GESRREREAIERQLQQLRKTGADNGCPESIEVGGQRHSVADPIREQGGAAQALAAARKTLREIQGGGRCADSSDPTACHMLHELWSRLVNALECHADAPPVSEKPANAVSAPAAAVAGGHALMDMVDDPGDGGTGAGSAGQPASATPISKPKPPASGSRQAHLSRAAFPTPRCQFVTDGDERHDAKRWVCVAGEVYECRDRSSTDPSNAWSRVSTGGCGEVRAIERIEQERFEQRRQADNIYEPE
ncbi:MAG: hypothetical protein KIT73_12910, partial [Burkholderiales bacterium]|nr:hypothetical protein [Burkholderiales bacterium]